MVDTKQARWVYRVARDFCGLGIFFCFAETSFCDYVLWSKIVVWLWDGVILFLLNIVINSFPRLSDFTDCGVKHSKYSIKLTT